MHDDELIEHVTKSMVFDKTLLEEKGMAADIWEKYLPRSTSKQMKKKGEYLFHVGDRLGGLYFIKKGKVKGRFLGKDGSLKTIAVLSEGCVLGEQLVLHGQPSLFESLVVEDAELYFFDKKTLLNILQNDFDMNLYVFKSLAIKSRIMATQLEDICMRSNIESICRILYSFCCYEEKSGTIVGDLTIHLSHQDLAHMLSAHRVTITNNLIKLKKKGVLDYKYEKIVIKDREKLKKIAYEETE